MAGASDSAHGASTSTTTAVTSDSTAGRTSNGNNVAEAAGIAGFDRIEFPEPLNWTGGPRLFPGNVIAGYNADYDKHTPESWAAYVLQKSRAFDRCTTAVAFSAINSGTPKVRVWFGYAFAGGRSTLDDYKRVDEVQDSFAFTRD